MQFEKALGLYSNPFTEELAMGNTALAEGWGAKSDVSASVDLANSRAIYARLVRRKSDIGLRFRRMYSRMKYGDPVAVRSAALLLMNKIIGNPLFREAVDNQETIVLTSSAFGSVPTAAHAIMKDIASLLRQRGTKLEEIKIDRAGDFATTAYGSMSEEERRMRMASRRITIGEEARQALRGRICFVIDDVHVTGSHEATLRQLLETTEARNSVFCYLLYFSEELAITEPQAEDCFNHSAIQSISDLASFFVTPKNSEFELRVNARTIKFILETGDSSDTGKVEKLCHLREFLVGLETAVLLKLYEAAISVDGYFRNPKFTDGFHALADVLVSRKAIPISQVHQDGKVTAMYSVTIDSRGNLFDMETGRDLNDLGKKYSLMKHGSYADIAWFGEQVARKFIARLEDQNDSLLGFFQQVKASQEHLALVSPGSRNVESSQNFIFEVAIKRINVWLALRHLPTLILVKLPRFSSGTANYAELSAEARMSEKRGNNITRSVLPGDDFFLPGTHVVFADDARITGASADRVETVCLERGARSFLSVYCVVVDPKVVADNPAVEHFLNTFLVKGDLDESVVYILSQEEFKPVQRTLRLLLAIRNRSILKEFLREKIGNMALIRVYESALGNGYASDERYAESISILQEVLRERNLIGDDGLLAG
jgi:predicted amidophosphoribosyltransferase